MSQEREERVLVDGGFCFRREEVYLQVDMLWRVAFALYQERGISDKERQASDKERGASDKKRGISEKEIGLLPQERGMSVEELYYAYYFVLMVFRHPEHGFKLTRVSYSL